MKKALLIIFCLIFALSFTGCKAKDAAKGKDSKNSSVSTETDHSIPEINYDTTYKAPAEFIEIDKSLEDPSNDDILFTYNSLGQVETCVYNYNDQTITLVYSYSETEATIYGFIDSTLICDIRVELTTTFDPNGAFTAKNGVYLKGY